MTLFYEFKRIIWKSSDEQMTTKATIITRSTSINPKIVPLPEQNENFLLIYTDFYDTVDTLFVPPPPLFSQLMNDRHVRITEETEEGYFTIIYSTSSSEVEQSIKRIIFLLILAFLFETFLAIVLGFWLSGKLIKPVREVIHLASTTDLLNNTELLRDPGNEDELKQLTQSFNRMLLRIKEQSEQQNAFLASASHELRTPLAVMQTRLQVLLQDKSLQEDNVLLYQQQLQDIKRMAQMVNDFLLLSELQSEHFKIFKTTCHLPDMIMNTIARHKEKASDRGLRFKVLFLPADEDFILQADIDKLLRSFLKKNKMVYLYL